MLFIILAIVLVTYVLSKIFGWDFARVMITAIFTLGAMLVIGLVVGGIMVYSIVNLFL